MKLTADIAYQYLCKARKDNNGKWIEHSFYVGEAAGLIAENIDNIDADKARSFGYLHDIGRSMGEMQIRHIFCGYYLLNEKGYKDAARICLTHSFPIKEITTVTGVWDCGDDEYEFLQNYLENTNYDIYDKLIQLCDNIGAAEGIVILEKRLVDIVRRYGIDYENLLNRWERLFKLKKEFENLMGRSLEDVLKLNSTSRCEFKSKYSHEDARGDICDL